MALLYSNENFPLPVVEALRQMGHDVLTSLMSGKANQSIPDADVLTYAAGEKRILLTLNRRHFILLHNEGTVSHAGIVVCTFDPDWTALANRIHVALQAEPQMAGKLLRINLPS